MEDLSHWDFADEFSGYDAAALILGIEPKTSSGDYSIGPVEDRLRKDYKKLTQKLMQDRFECDEDWGSTRGKFTQPPETGLLSIALRKQWDHWFAAKSHTALDKWFRGAYWCDFDRQEFDRKTIVNWLKDEGFKSAYDFSRIRQNQPQFSQKHDLTPITTKCAEVTKSDMKDASADEKRQAARNALEVHSNNVTNAAKHLGVDRKTLRRWAEFTPTTSSPFQGLVHKR
jgi:Bacterial regulatory protein, Fis family